MSVLTKVREFLKDLVGVEEFTENSKLVDDLGMCEEDVAELLLNLEEEYSLPEFTAEEYYNVFTVADVLEVVEKKLNPAEAVEPVVDEKT
jgi:acyl carrier protein